MGSRYTIARSYYSSFYFAKRPLRVGEVRDGGTTWNVLKNFAFFWTILVAVAAIWGMADVSKYSSTLQSETETAGATIGTALGLGMIRALWFFPFIGAVVLGLILKKSSIVEKGPTGSLATTSVQDEPPTVSPKKAIGWTGWIGMGFVSLLILGIIGSSLYKSFVVKELKVADFEWNGPPGNQYLVGTVRNHSDKQYSYVQVEFNLYDENGV